MCSDFRADFRCREAATQLFTAPLKPRKQPQSLGFQTPDAGKRYVNPAEETLEKLVPGYFATSADLPTQNCQSRRARARLLPESRASGAAELRSQPEDGLGTGRRVCPYKLACSCPPLNATAVKAAPRSCPLVAEKDKPAVVPHLFGG